MVGGAELRAWASRWCVERCRASAAAFLHDVRPSWRPPRRRRGRDRRGACRHERRREVRAAVGAAAPPMSDAISLSHKAEYAAIRAVVRALGLLDWRVAGGIGARIGGLGYRPLGIRRQVVERQIAAAFP